MTTEILGAFLALLFVLGLILSASWLMRRMGWMPGGKLPATTKSIDIIDQRTVDMKTRLIVARWRGNDYFLATSGETTCVIDKKKSALDPEAAAGLSGAER